MAQAYRSIGLTAVLDIFRTPEKRSLSRRLAIALLIFAISLAARAAIDWMVPGRVPFITFFPALLLVAFYCGLVPSLLVLVLSAVMGVYLASAPGGNEMAYRLTIFILFLFAGGANVAVVLYLVHAMTLLRTRDDELALINGELNHRLKNVFAITEAIARQTIREGGEPAALAHAISGRIRAIAAAQDILTARRLEGTDLRVLIQKVAVPLAPAPDRIRMSGPPFDLPENATTPFSLILHELATNAVKYGAWRPDGGVVSISWSVAANVLDFDWREHDGPPIIPPTREGLGSTLIRRGLPDAKVEHSIHKDGVECHIRLPV